MDRGYVHSKLVKISVTNVSQLHKREISADIRNLKPDELRECYYVYFNHASYTTLHRSREKLFLFLYLEVNNWINLLEKIGSMWHENSSVNYS